MAEYEHVVDGEVVERVTTVDGGFEDTRLGVAALEREADGDGWRRVDLLPQLVEPSKLADQAEQESGTPADPPADEDTAPKPKPKTEKKD